MTNQITSYDHHKYMETFYQLMCKGMEFVHKYFPISIRDVVVFSRVSNITHYEFIVNAKLDMFIFPNPDKTKKTQVTPWSKICTHSGVSNSAKFLKILLDNNIKHLIYDIYGITWRDRYNNHKFLFIHGLSYEGSEDCQVGKGILYATPKYNKQDINIDNCKPRHDFILINQGVDKPFLLGCIVLMFELAIDAKKSLAFNILEETKVFLIVQYLIEYKGKETSKNNQKRIGQQFQWAANPNKPTEFDYGLIAAQSIVRPVLVIPYITRLNKIKSNQLNPTNLLNLQYNPCQPHINDRFNLIDRYFFDRSG